MSVALIVWVILNWNSLWPSSITPRCPCRVHVLLISRLWSMSRGCGRTVSLYAVCGLFIDSSSSTAVLWVWYRASKHHQLQNGITTVSQPLTQLAGTFLWTVLHAGMKDEESEDLHRYCRNWCMANLRDTFGSYYSRQLFFLSYSQRWTASSLLKESKNLPARSLANRIRTVIVLSSWIMAIVFTLQTTFYGASWTAS